MTKKYSHNLYNSYQPGIICDDRIIMHLLIDGGLMLDERQRICDIIVKALNAAEQAKTYNPRRQSAKITAALQRVDERVEDGEEITRAVNEEAKNLAVSNAGIWAALRRRSRMAEIGDSDSK